LRRQRSSAKQFRDTLLSFHTLDQVNGRQQRMLDTTVIAPEENIIKRHGSGPTKCFWSILIEKAETGFSNEPPTRKFNGMDTVRTSSSEMIQRYFEIIDR